jgi:dethiobiotin synthetase
MVAETVVEIGARMKSAKIIFVTGTDTGVGKTLFTALLLRHLRARGVRALAMKPFCSGGRGDARLLQSLQRGELSDDQMNPFYFSAPLAPLAAAPRGGAVRLGDALRKVRQVAGKCDQLVIEGSGGLLTPLGPGYTFADIITKLPCRVIIVARNSLGTINHTLLTVAALEGAGIRRQRLGIVLMSVAKPDLSARSNPTILRALLAPMGVMCLPYFGRRVSTEEFVRRKGEKMGRELGLVL